MAPHQCFKSGTCLFLWFSFYFIPFHSIVYYQFLSVYLPTRMTNCFAFSLIHTFMHIMISKNYDITINWSYHVMSNSKYQNMIISIEYHTHAYMLQLCSTYLAINIMTIWQYDSMIEKCCRRVLRELWRSSNTRKFKYSIVKIQSKQTAILLLLFLLFLMLLLFVLQLLLLQLLLLLLLSLLLLSFLYYVYCYYCYNHYSLF